MSHHEVIHGASRRTNREDSMAGATSRKIFVNLAVQDLDRAVAFFTALGFSFDERLLLL